MFRNLLLTLSLIAGVSISGGAGAALVVDARVDGVSRYCAAAATFGYRNRGATTWRCGTSTYTCWSDPVHLFYPTDGYVLVDCSTTRPPWATDPPATLIFGSSFE